MVSGGPMATGVHLFPEQSIRKENSPNLDIPAYVL